MTSSISISHPLFFYSNLLNFLFSLVHVDIYGSWFMAHGSCTFILIGVLAGFSLRRLILLLIFRGSRCRERGGRDSSKEGREMERGVFPLRVGIEGSRVVERRRMGWDRTEGHDASFSRLGFFVVVLLLVTYLHT